VRQHRLTGRDVRWNYALWTRYGLTALVMVYVWLALRLRLECCRCCCKAVYIKRS